MNIPLASSQVGSRKGRSVLSIPRPFRIYPVSFELEFNRATRDVHPHHAALIYALLRSAWARTQGADAALPDGVLVQTPEQLRTRFDVHSRYRFGLQVIEYEKGKATEIVAHLWEGLEQIGGDTADRSHAFGGNFSVVATVDMANGKELLPGASPTSVSDQWFDEQIQRARQQERLSLVFCSPLRCARHDRKQSEGHRYLDRHHFELGTFARRIVDRCRRLGVERWPRDYFDRLSTGTVVHNGLVWLDVSYGAAGRRKSLGGCMGRIHVHNVHPDFAELLAFGQLLHVGENVNFGFGRYYLAELNDRSMICRRSSVVSGRRSAASSACSN